MPFLPRTLAGDEVEVGVGVEAPGQQAPEEQKEVEAAPRWAGRCLLARGARRQQWKCSDTRDKVGGGGSSRVPPPPPPLLLLLLLLLLTYPHHHRQQARTHDGPVICAWAWG